jgi:hypothetical protein
MESCTLATVLPQKGSLMEPPTPESAVHELLHTLRSLQVQGAVHMRLALASAAPPSTESVRPLSNRPLSSFYRATPGPLWTRFRRNLGIPFFIDYAGTSPALNPDHVKRNTQLAVRPLLHERVQKFTASDNAALLEAVLRVRLSEMYEEALRGYGLSFPDSHRPLGTVSAPVLPDPGPRAESQYKEAFSLAAVGEGNLARLTAQQRDSLRAELAAIAALPPAAVLAGAEDCDWTRVAHGGFLRTKLGTRPSDARVQWVAHVKPGTRHSPLTAAELERLQSIASARQYRDWAAIAAELNTGHGAWECFTQLCRRRIITKETTEAALEDYTFNETASAAESGDDSDCESRDVCPSAVKDVAPHVGSPSLWYGSGNSSTTGAASATPFEWTADHDALLSIAVSSPRVCAPHCLKCRHSHCYPCRVGCTVRELQLSLRECQSRSRQHQLFVGAVCFTCFLEFLIIFFAASCLSRSVLSSAQRLPRQLPEKTRLPLPATDGGQRNGRC